MTLRKILAKTVRESATHSSAKSDGLLRRERPKMRLYLSDTLPSLQLTFASGDSNEYRLRQGEVEFRVDEKAWRLLDESEVQFHFVLHTEVAEWLQTRRAELA